MGQKLRGWLEPGVVFFKGVRVPICVPGGGGFGVSSVCGGWFACGKKREKGNGGGERGGWGGERQWKQKVNAHAFGETL